VPERQVGEQITSLRGKIWRELKKHRGDFTLEEERRQPDFRRRESSDVWIELNVGFTRGERPRSLGRVRDWQRELSEVISLNVQVGPAAAASRFRQVVEQCPPAELYALESEVTAALSSFPADHRNRLKAYLAIRRVASPAPRPAPPKVPARREPAAAKRSPGREVRDDEFTRRVDDISALLASVHPGEAEAAFRQLIADLRDEQLLAREDTLLNLADLFLPKRRRVLVSLLDGLLDTIDVPAPAPKPAPEPATIPASEPVTISASEPATVPAPKPATVPAQEAVTAKAQEAVTAKAQEAVTVPAPKPATVPTPAAVRPKTPIPRRPLAVPGPRPARPSGDR
jgi:hypothetical protein